MLILRNKFKEIGSHEKIIEWLDEWYTSITDIESHEITNKERFYFLENIWFRCTSDDAECIILANRPLLLKIFFKQEYPSLGISYDLLLRLYIDLIKNDNLLILSRNLN